MSHLYELISTPQGSSITVLSNGRVFTATNTHPSFGAIVEGVVKGDPDVFGLFDATSAMSRAFDKVSDRISLRDGHLYVDGERADNSLSAQIVRFQTEGITDFLPLVNFYEKVLTCPNKNSRDQLYTWLSDRDFTITDDGDFIAYKGLTNELGSVHQGPAIVDGVPVDGSVPHLPGSIVEMPRGDVNDNPNHGCSTGLHAATWEYASGWGQRTVKVKINPRDVVSVPRDSSFQKLRVCRYEVLCEVDQPSNRAINADNGDDWAPDFDLTTSDVWGYGSYQEG
jgi:hypothetical protein